MHTGLKEVLRSCAEGTVLVKHSELAISVAEKQIPCKIEGKVFHPPILYLNIHKEAGVIQIVDVVR